jgi:hypothetical protein
MEMNYCRTVRPSREFDVMGVSMISPDGLAIKPRIPASCRICGAVEPSLYLEHDPPAARTFVLAVQIAVR